MNFWAVLKNISLFISLGKSLSSLIQSAVATKAAPSKEAIKSLLDSVEALLDSGAIDVPGVDEAAVSEALKQIEAGLIG